MGQAGHMEVVDAARGSNGVQSQDLALTDGAVLVARGLPNLEHRVLGQPVELAPFDEIVLGSGEHELQYLCMGGWRPAAQASRGGQ